MVHEPVAHARFMNVARLRVAYFEMVVPAVPIRARHKFVVQLQNVLHQIPSKLMYIGAFVFPLYKLPPRFKQVFCRNDILVCKTP